MKFKYRTQAVQQMASQVEPHSRRMVRTPQYTPSQTLTFEAVAKEPEFALGDSNGISPTTLHTMIMVDTTCPTARKIHYARSNFKFDFQGGTNIATESAPILDYKAPGAFGEKGDNRQYTFLMYINPERNEITDLQLPAESEIFDIAKFEKDNGLNPATAGVNMVVKLGGQADCEGGDANPAPPAQSAASSAASSAVASSSAASSSTAVSSSTVATSSAATSSAAASPSSIAPSSAAATRSVTASSSVAASSLVTATSTLVASLSVRPSAAPSSGGSVITVRPPTSVTTRVADANESQAPVSSAAGGATSASTTPAEQTANAAAGQSFAQGAVVVPLLAMVGALAL
jgi:hypothetical protein